MYFQICRFSKISIGPSSHICELYDYLLYIYLFYTFKNLDLMNLKILSG
jgi:hypothetical protein